MASFGVWPFGSVVLCYLVWCGVVLCCVVVCCVVLCRVVLCCVIWWSVVLCCVVLCCVVLCRVVFRFALLRVVVCVLVSRVAQPCGRPGKGAICALPAMRFWGF